MSNKPNSKNYQESADDAESKKGCQATNNDKNKNKNNKPRNSNRKPRPVKDNRLFPGSDSTNNDPSWYIPNGQVAKDFASIPFGTINGKPLPKWKNGYPKQFYYPTQTQGIMRFDVFHTLGWSQSQQDAINYSASYLFVNVMAQNSRSLPSNYEAADMALATYAITEAYAFYAMVSRAYGLLLNYDIQDRFTPYGLFEQMGLDYDDLSENIADFRGWINMLAIKMGTLYLPTGIKYTQRRIFLYQNIYRDSESTKAQYYFFQPVGFYVWNEGDPTNPVSSLNFVELNPTKKLLKLRDLQEFAHTLLDPLFGSQDIANVATVFLQAFGSSKVFSVNPISETYKVTPVYNREVLMQMENAYVCNFPTSAWIPSGKITQETHINSGYLKTEYKMTFGRGSLASSIMGDDHQAWEKISSSYSTNRDDLIAMTNPDYVMINSHQGALKPEDVLVATRLSTPPQAVDVTTVGSNEDPVVSLRTTQTELILNVNMLGVSSDPIGRTVYTSANFSRNMYIGNSTPSAEWSLLRMNWLLSLMKFDWHFSVQGVDLNITGERVTTSETTLGWDVDDYTYVPLVDMEQINEMAQLALFMPELSGSYNKNK